MIYKTTHGSDQVKNMCYYVELSLKRTVYHLYGVAADLHAISVEQLIQVILKMTGVTCKVSFC